MKTASTKDCQVWVRYRTRKGYGQTWDRQQKRRRRAHRVVWEIFNGPIPKGAFVLHRCDNPPCVNPDHLYVGTAADNTRDMIRRGRVSAGERRDNARLTREMVRQIRHVYASGRKTKAALARIFGVSPSTIRAAVGRVTWRHVQ